MSISTKKKTSYATSQKRINAKPTDIAPSELCLSVIKQFARSYKSYSTDKNGCVDMVIS